MDDVDRPVYGWWVIRTHEGQEHHRIESHEPEGTSSHERAERGILRKVNLDRYVVEWENAAR